MTRISLEKILETAQQCGVAVEMTPSESPFVVQTSGGLRRLSPFDMVPMVGDYSADDYFHFL